MPGPGEDHQRADRDGEVDERGDAHPRSEGEVETAPQRTRSARSGWPSGRGASSSGAVRLVRSSAPRRASIAAELANRPAITDSLDLKSVQLSRCGRRLVPSRAHGASGEGVRSGDPPPRDPGARVADRRAAVPARRHRRGRPPRHAATRRPGRGVVDPPHRLRRLHLPRLRDDRRGRPADRRRRRTRGRAPGGAGALARRPAVGAAGGRDRDLRPGRSCGSSAPTATSP